jgi:hypothetical protein
MEKNPTYTLWHPSLMQEEDSFSTITINITPFACDSMPSGPKEFFIQILQDMGVSINPISWQVLTYRSNYHGEREDPMYWQDEWVKNWRIAIKINQKLTSLEPWSYEFRETSAYSVDPDWHNQEHESAINCMIIADFKKKADLDITQVNINQSTQVQRMAEEISAPLPEFYTVEIGGMFYQLQICLGQFAETFFENCAAYALAVEDVCREVGGITSFDERVNEWGEL